MLYERLWKDYRTTANCMTLIDEKNIHSQHATVNFLLKYKQRAFKETSLLLRITLAGALIEDTYLSTVSESRKYLNRYLILYANNIYQVRIFIIFYYHCCCFFFFALDCSELKS